MAGAGRHHNQHPGPQALRKLGDAGGGMLSLSDVGG